MGWIHAGTGGAGSYCMDDPLYAANRALGHAYEKAARKLFAARGICPPTMPSSREWWRIFTCGGEYHTIPTPGEVTTVIAGTLEVYIGKKQWKRMDPLDAKTKEGLEWILPRLEALKKRHDEAKNLSDPVKIQEIAKEIECL